MLLVEPAYRRAHGAIKRCAATKGTADFTRMPDESLWYPPLGLMKLATLHRNRGDDVHFEHGCNEQLLGVDASFSGKPSWDRVYIGTLFTFNWKRTIQAIEFYKGLVDGAVDRVFVGGMMASLMNDEIFTETGVRPVTGVLDSPQQIGLEGNEAIDMLPPDYGILRGLPYAVNDTYYAYTTRGCINKCEWCGVPAIEPNYVPYIDIKDMVNKLRQRYGDKSRLKLMDNNVLASAHLPQIVDDLVQLGYGRGCHTTTNPPKQRVIDFNQGLDATFITEENARLLGKLNIKPMRIAFDRAGEKDDYTRALRIMKKRGARVFSNYMLYNCKDSPRDLYERLMVNIRLSRRWRDRQGKPTATIFSYPMRYAPIGGAPGSGESRQRDRVMSPPPSDRNLLTDAVWTMKFVRNIEVMKGAVHGAISATPSLARRTIGRSYEEFIANLYMPEEMLRNRNKYEKTIHNGEPPREPGTGDIEEFRSFVLRLAKRRDLRFLRFHEAVSKNRKAAIRSYLNECDDAEIARWLAVYLK